MGSESRNNFQYILLGIFIFFAVAGVAVFSLSGKFGGKKETGPTVELVVWGMEDKDNVEALINRISGRSASPLKIKYVEKRSDNFDQSLLEALAAGTGPDILLLPHDKLLEHKDKIYQISFDSYKQRTFRDTFIEEGELFLSPTGIYALPLSLDPLVMYWNRQLFTDAGLVLPPVYWDEFFSETIALTDMDNSRNILRSAVALGEYSNVLHSKEILSTLMMQSGNKIVDREENGNLKVVLDEGGEGGSAPAESALRFYTEFSNPSKQVYSWNKSLPDSKAEFVANDLAIYFGFASESAEIIRKNPNLNFDVAVMPQIRDASRVTYGKITGLAILNRSKYKADAFLALNILTSEASLKDWAEITVLPPVSRKLLAKRPKEAYPAVFYDSAVISRGWLDPEKEKSSLVFQRMVENVISGRLRPREAANRAASELEALIK